MCAVRNRAEIDCVLSWTVIYQLKLQISLCISNNLAQHLLKKLFFLSRSLEELNPLREEVRNFVLSLENAAKAAERTETINIVRSLIDYNKELFELPAEDLNQVQ